MPDPMCYNKFNIAYCGVRTEEQIMMTFLAIVIPYIVIYNILDWYVFGGRERAWAAKVLEESAAKAEGQAKLRYSAACYVEAQYRMNSPSYDPDSHGNYCICDDCIEHTEWHTDN